MTFKVKLLTRKHGGGGTREITTNFAGCKDADDARDKAHEIYNVVTIMWIKPVEDKKGKS